MVFTNAQVASFMQDADQMHLSAATTIYLQTAEGIVTVDDLLNFQGDEVWNKIQSSARKPPQIPNPPAGTAGHVAGVAVGELVNQAPMIISAKSYQRLVIASAAVAFYQQTDRPLSANNMHWNRLANFKVQYDTIKDKKKHGETLEVPVIGKNMSVVQWIEAYASYAHQYIGVRKAPIAYIIREDAAVPMPAPPLAPNAAHTVEGGSILDDMVARFSHTHPLSRDDNRKVYDDIELACRGTKYQASIAPFKKRRDGRAAYLALVLHHAGAAYWDAEVKKNFDFLINRLYTDGTSITLELYISQHRRAFTQLQLCAEHVSVQVPQERTRVGYLLTNIVVTNADVKAAQAAIKMDDTPTGLRNNFERSAALLVPVCPVGTKKASKRSLANVSDVSARGASKSGGGKLKESFGTTGVSLRYHSSTEYSALNKEQKDELREWRRLNKAVRGKSKGSRNKFDNKKLKSHIASVIQGMEQQKLEKQEKMDEAKAMMASIISAGYETPSVAEIAASRANPEAEKSNKKLRMNAADLHTRQNAAAEVCAAKFMDMLSIDGKKSGSKKSGGR